MAAMNLMLVLMATMAMLASALQVAPGSPCASFCIDSDLDPSDPNLSNTSGNEITCNDDDFESKATGQKFQRCLTCLQDSTYAQGGETDQTWFLYNMRYAFDYCIFGFPNATDVGSSPCITSEACGPLKDSLISGISAPADSSEYDYCGVSDGGALIGDPFTNCQQCVQATGDRFYLSNFLTALEAGCEQQPAAGVLLGLNDTVFTTSTIGIVDPTTDLKDGSSASGLSTPAIAGIAIGGVVLLLLAAGCVFMQCRKRRNRAARMARRSSLSFRCMTQVDHSPSTPDLHAQMVDIEEKPYMDPSAALSSNPVSRDSYWETQSMKAGPRNGTKLSSITTSVPAPPPVHASPARMSPDDYTTPTSTTSVRSNAPLLYQQQYHSSPLQNQTSVFGGGFAAPTTSPSQNQQDLWGQQQSRDLVGRNTSGPIVPGRPVNMTNIQTKFPPPPKR